MIPWELCKKLKFHHINEWYMHKPKSIYEKETHSVLWDFEILDNSVQARRPDLVLNKKKEPVI